MDTSVGYASVCSWRGLSAYSPAVLSDLCVLRFVLPKLIKTLNREIAENGRRVLLKFGLFGLAVTMLKCVFKDRPDLRGNRSYWRYWFWFHALFRNLPRRSDLSAEIQKPDLRGVHRHPCWLRSREFNR